MGRVWDRIFSVSAYEAFFKKNEYCKIKSFDEASSLMCFSEKVAPETKHKVTPNLIFVRKNFLE